MSWPAVDVNLFAYNAEATIGPAIESVLAQTWPAIRLTVIDNASTDRTAAIAAGYGDLLRVYRARANGGAVVNCQRAFTLGDADFVLPKTADDLIAPDFVERTMAVLLAHPECAMCHAGGVIFRAGQALEPYPPEHRLHAAGDDPSARARHTMARYTSAPSFWGVYRRAAADKRAPFRYRPGWDHAALAELALYGEIRHVPAPLYWRRDGGKPVAQIARGCTEAAQRGLPLDALADLRWRTPLIATAHAQLETFAVARVAAAQRAASMADAIRIFRGRWLAAMQAEAAAFAAGLPALHAEAAQTPEPLRGWKLRQIAETAAAVAALIPEAASAMLCRAATGHDDGAQSSRWLHGGP